MSVPSCSSPLTADRAGDDAPVSAAADVVINEPSEVQAEEQSEPVCQEEPVQRGTVEPSNCGVVQAFRNLLDYFAFMDFSLPLTWPPWGLKAKAE